MANEKVSQMTSLSAIELAGGDVLLITDISARESKKLSITNLLTYVEATGSFHTTNSDTASYILGSGVRGTVVSSSYSQTSSFSNYSLLSNLSNTSSLALTASVTLACITHTVTADTASFLNYSGVFNGTASYALTASNVNRALTSSFLLYTPGVNNGTASYALSCSIAQNAISASFATSASVAISASYSISSSNSQTSSYISHTAYTVPAGTIITFAANASPNGWLECDGTAVSRTTYLVLYNTIGTTYGSGDGSTTFNLPDLRGYFIRGWDHGKGLDSGRAFATVQNDSLKDHTHGMPNMVAGYYGPGRDVGSGGGSISALGYYTTAVSAPNDAGVETRPKNISMMYCIKY